MNTPGKNHYIKYNWVSDDPRVLEKAKELAVLRRGGQQRQSKRPFEEAFNAILTSFEVLGIYQGYDLLIPTNTSLYHGKEQRNPTYTSEVLDALKFLINRNYIVKIKGKTRIINNHKDIWLPNTYSVTSKWLEEISSVPLSDKAQTRRNPLLPYTELREDFWKEGQKHKRAIPILPAQKKLHRDMLESTDHVLRAYDDFIRTTKLTVGNIEIYPAQLSLTRIFSKGKLELGGRLYSVIQGLKKEVRKHINLNDEPTIEVDYWSIHPYLAYHSRGLDYSGEDPYVVDGSERDTVKTAFNIMINRKGTGGKKSAAKTLSEELEMSLEEAERLEEAIKALHSPIAELFNSGAGLALQRQDSDIALEVIRYFIDRNIPIIPIHDSFIVPVRYTEDLLLVMRDCYTKVLYGSEPPLDILGFKGFKGDMRDCSKDMEEAITRCFEGNTEGMDDIFWDNLIAKEPVQSSPLLEQYYIDTEYE